MMGREDIIRERKGYKYRRQEGKITVRMFGRFIRNYNVNYLKKITAHRILHINIHI